ncbi:MAG TPA: diacylglycerol kinase family protein [Terriglobia bacterium]|nr:diacylglycerol kinase family protein [Terriglobia bacterium]
MSRATLIYNPVAGRNPARREGEIQAAAGILQQAGFVLDVRPTTGPSSARDLALAAARDGSRAVIVCGGDGTLNEVVNGLVGSACPLAILPGGTANIAAKDLGLPDDPVSAARQLARAVLRRIGLGRVTWGPAGQGAAPLPRYFLSVAGVGFDAYVVHRLEWDFKASLGVLAYGWESIRQALRYGFPSFVCHGEREERRATLAVFLLTEIYAGWFHLAPGASLLDGRLRACLFEGRHAWRYALYAVAAALRRHLKLSDVRLAEDAPFACSAPGARRRIYVEVDGELAGQLPATFEWVPDALTLLLPERRWR